MIKIPATLEGLPAITATLAKGISVNVTLIFSLSATSRSSTLTSRASLRLPPSATT